MSDTKPGTLDDLIRMEAGCDFVRWATFDAECGRWYAASTLSHVPESFGEWCKDIWDRPAERQADWVKGIIARWTKEGAARAAEQRTAIAKLVEENRALRTRLADITCRNEI